MDQLKTSPSFVDEEQILAIKSGGAKGDKATMSLYGLYHKDIKACIGALVSRYGPFNLQPVDIVHDSFIVMLHKIRTENPEIISIRAYWLGIARHIWLNEIRKYKNLNIVSETDAYYGHYDRTPESILLFDERSIEIERCMCRCGKRCREVLLLWLAEYSMKEIADRMNLSGPAMARKIKHECFKKLKDLLIKHNILNT